MGRPTRNRRDGKQALEEPIELLPPLLHKLHALLLAEDALGWQPQVVGGQVPERHTSQQSSQIRMSLAMLSCIRDM